MPTLDLSTAQRRILASGRWFGALPFPLQEALLSHARVSTFRPGQQVFRRGDKNDGLYAVLDGAIRFGSQSRSGRESVVGLAGPPQWFGEVSLLDAGRRTHHAWAEADATLAHVPLATVADWLARHPADWRCIGQLAVDKLRLMFAAIEGASLHTPRERLIGCLLLLATAYGQRDVPPSRVLRVSQERLGSILSLSRQTVNGLLKDLEHDGLVTRARGRIRIADFDRLRASGAPVS